MPTLVLAFAVQVQDLGLRYLGSQGVEARHHWREVQAVQGCQVHDGGRPLRRAVLEEYFDWHRRLWGPGFARLQSSRVVVARLRPK